MDERITTIKVLFALTEERHREECLDWWKLNFREYFPMIERWLTEIDAVVYRYPAPRTPSYCYTMVEAKCGIFKADPYSRYWDKPLDGDTWRFSEEEELFFDREFTTDEVKGYKLDTSKLATAIAQALGVAPNVEVNHPFYCRLGLLKGKTAYIAFGHLKMLHNSLFDLFMLKGIPTTIFTLGTNNITVEFKIYHKMDIRDISNFIRIEKDGAIKAIAYEDKDIVAVKTNDTEKARYIVTNRAGRKYLVPEDCIQITELTEGKQNNKKAPIVLRSITRAYLQVLLEKRGQIIKRTELEKLALERLIAIDKDEIFPNDSRLSNVFRTTTDKGKKVSLGIYKAIICKKGWGGGSYLLPAESVVKQ